MVALGPGAYSVPTYYWNTRSAKHSQPPFLEFGLAIATTWLPSEDGGISNDEMLLPQGNI